MTPEEIARDRPVRIVETTFSGEVIHSSERAGSLVRCYNDRGPFEVLIPADRRERLEPLLVGRESLCLRGYWRRRSGFRADGSRHFVWTLVLLDVLLEETLAAA